MRLTDPLRTTETVLRELAGLPGHVREVVVVLRGAERSLRRLADGSTDLVAELTTLRADVTTGLAEVREDVERLRRDLEMNREDLGRRLDRLGDEAGPISEVRRMRAAAERLVTDFEKIPGI